MLLGYEVFPLPKNVKNAYDEDGMNIFFDMVSKKKFTEVDKKGIKSKRFNGINDAKEYMLPRMESGKTLLCALADTSTNRLIFRTGSKPGVIFNYFDAQTDAKLKEILNRVCNRESFEIVPDENELPMVIAQVKGKKVPIEHNSGAVEAFLMKLHDRNISKIIVRDIRQQLEYHLDKNEKGSIIISCGLH